MNNGNNNEKFSYETDLQIYHSLVYTVEVNVKKNRHILKLLSYRLISDSKPK